MSGMARYPFPLKLALADLSKPNHFYGESRNLQKARKRAAGKTNVRFLVRRLLRKMEA